MTEQTTPDHEIVWTFDDYYVRAKAQCNAPATALCRNADTDCGCEYWSNVGQDADGHYHVVDGAKHRHEPSRYCNICEWLNADDILECAVSNTHLTIAKTPIRAVWHGEGYDWEPAS